ncbi:MAG TPA: DUF5691 domain-containing protein [Pseudonocardiaceae bacterium]
MTTFESSSVTEATPQAWQETVRRLLAGGGRAGTDPAALLDNCAALGTARRGARLPDAAGTAVPVSPAPSDPRPEGSERLAGLLTRMLAGGDKDLITEWCRSVADAGLTAPYCCLPDLLAYGTGRSGMRPAIHEVLGARGRWLAAMRPAWSWAGHDQSAWEDQDLEALLDAPAPVRLAGLRRARRRDPDGTREFLAAQYAAQRRAADRRVLVEALEEGLGPADEPLLERMLRDRAVEVHDAAVQLLRRLPGSALSRRAAERLRAGVVLVDGVLEVRPDGPFGTEPTEEERLDLLWEGGGGRGRWGRLHGAAASVPPEFWTELLDLDVQSAIEVVAETPEFLHGLVAALPQAADPVPWLVAALRTWGTGSNALRVSYRMSDLPVEQAERALFELLPDCEHDLIAHVCEYLPTPWSAAMTAALVERYMALEDPEWRQNQVPDLLVHRGDVDVLVQAWPRITARWPEHATETGVLELRVALRDAIREHRTV